MSTPRDLSLRFVEAFCEGDLDTVAGLLSADFRFDGPLLRTRSRQEYLRRLRDDPPEKNATYRLVRSVEDGDEACLFYEYAKSEQRGLIAQWTRRRGERIAEMLLVFETRPPGE